MGECIAAWQGRCGGWECRMDEVGSSVGWMCQRWVCYGVDVPRGECATGWMYLLWGGCAMAWLAAQGGCYNLVCRQGDCSGCGHGVGGGFGCRDVAATVGMGRWL